MRITANTKQNTKKERNASYILQPYCTIGANCCKTSPSNNYFFIAILSPAQIRGKKPNLLSHVTLRGWVERRQFHCFCVLGPHLKQDLLKRVELASLSIHIILVHLGDEDNRIDINKVKKIKHQIDVLRHSERLPHQPWERDVPLQRIELHPQCTVCSEPDL